MHAFGGWVTFRSDLGQSVYGLPSSSSSLKGSLPDNLGAASRARRPVNRDDQTVGVGP
jgi:hypothetical protein